MRVVLLILTLSFWVATPAPAAQDPPAQPTAAESHRPLVIYLDVHASTWRSRGRISFGIVPSLRMKLASAGFTVTQDPESAHDLTLEVNYREELGKPISINLNGTEIVCLMVLTDPQQGHVLSTRIHESPHYAELVSAPYVEVVDQFQTNPYFYFLGDLIRGWTDARLDTTGALIQALARQFDQELHPPAQNSMDTLLSPAETFADLDLHFAPLAQQNTVEELGRLKDPRAIELLERLAFHSNGQIRLRAVLALGQFDVPSVAPAMTRVVQADPDKGVRDAAAAILAKFAHP